VLAVLQAIDCWLAMVTAESKLKTWSQRARNGVNNYIVKPFNAQTLKSKIESVLADNR
jgi:two-component system chemotaxis response regulator CheY